MNAANNSILNLKPKEILNHFLRDCRGIGLSDIDLHYINEIAIRTIRHLSASSAERVITADAQELENRWYASLSSGAPDFSVYSSKYYLAEMIACFIVYSRKHILNVNSEKSLFGKSILSSLGNINGILDLGCGIAYTTAGFKCVYNSAQVTGFDLPGTRQYEIAVRLANKYGFNLEVSIKNVKHPVDLIFASEYFEHIHNPIEHLRDILNIFSPKAMLIANAFNTRAIGHFTSYSHNGAVIPQEQISKMFNNYLCERGYKKVKTKLWNNRPAFWRK